MKILSIVIPNFNGEELLKKNIPKLIEVIGEMGSDPSGRESPTSGRENYEIEVIVVDDGSTDNSVSEIKNYELKITNYKHITIKLIRNKQNCGFATTVNRGVREARGEIVVLLNTDVYPKSGFLDPVIPLFEKDEKLFAVGFLDESTEDGTTVKRGRGIGWWEKGFVLHKRGEVDKTDTFWVSGGSCIIRKSIWERLGGLDENYNPFYWEDIDISYRAVKSGYTILFEPKAVVVHQHTQGAILKKYSQKDITTIAFRNQLFFIWKNITKGDLLRQHFLMLPQLLTKEFINGNPTYIKGFFQALPRLIYILNTRKKLKKMIVNPIDDNKLLSIKS